MAGVGAPTFLTKATVNGTATFDRPPGTVSGDFLLALATIDWNASGSVSTPSGWTLIGSSRALASSGHQIWAFYKVAGGSEPTTYTFTGASSGEIQRWAGVDASDPINTYNATMFDNWSGTSPRTNTGVTTDEDGCAIIFATHGQALASGGDAGRLTPRSSWTSSNSQVLTRTQATAGASGTLSHFGENGVYVSLAIALNGDGTGRNTTPEPYFVGDAQGSPTVTFTKPAWLVAGDLIVVNVYSGDATGVTVPSGFAQIATYSGYGLIRVYAKVAGGSEPSTYAFTATGGSGYHWSLMQVYGGADPSTPFGAGLAYGTASSSTSRTSAGVTTDRDLALAVMTSQGDQAATTADAAVLSAVAYGYSVCVGRPVPTAGASGTFAVGQSSGVWGQITFSVNPVETASSHSLTATGISSSPTVGAPAISQRHGLTATGITSSPAVGSPAIAQRHAITASALATAAPSVGAPAIAQQHALTATGIATGAPSVGSPSIALGNVLTATGIATTAPSVGTPAIAQVHAFTATALATAAPSVGSPAISQAHILTATGISASPTVGSPAIGQKHALTASGIATGAPSAGSPALAQNHVLAPSGIAAGTPIVGNPTLTPQGTLAALPIDFGTPTVGTPAITQRHALVATGITASPTVGAPALAQKHALAGAGIAAGTPSVGSPAIGQAHVLAATGVIASPTVGQPIIFQRHALTATGVSTGAPSVGSPSIATGSAWTANSIAAGDPTVGAPALAQRHALAAVGITASPTVGSPAIGQGHAFTAVNLSTLAPSVGSPAFSQLHALAAIGITTGAPTVGRPAMDLILAVSLDRQIVMAAVPRLVTIEAATRSIRA